MIHHRELGKLWLPWKGGYRMDTIRKSSEIAISINFTAEHAEDRIGLKTLRPPR
jgi:hypothetical protein